MTWDAYYRRQAVLKDIAEIIDRGRNYSLSGILAHHDPERTAFEDEASLLREAQLAWFQRLSGLLDQNIGEFADDPTEDAITCWVSAAEKLPGIRTLLDNHSADPALVVGIRNECVLMAQMAGALPTGQSIEAFGSQLIDQARDRAVYQTAAQSRFGVLDSGRKSGSSARPGSGFVARLRSVLAA